LNPSVRLISFGFTFQVVRGNKLAFQHLADDACGLTYAAVVHTQGISGRSKFEISKSITDHPQGLVRILTDIERFTRSKTRRLSIGRKLSTAGAIQKYRSSLERLQELVGLNPYLGIEGNIVQLVAKHATRAGNPWREQELGSRGANQKPGPGQHERWGGRESPRQQQPLFGPNSHIPIEDNRAQRFTGHEKMQMAMRGRESNYPGLGSENHEVQRQQGNAHLHGSRRPVAMAVTPPHRTTNADPWATTNRNISNLEDGSYYRGLQVSGDY